MTLELKRLSVRSVHADTIARLELLKEQTRLPAALLIEDSIDLLWDHYGEEGNADRETAIE